MIYARGIDIAVEICEYLDIDYMDINIGEAYDSLTEELAANDIKLSSNAATNLPARLDKMYDANTFKSMPMYNPNCNWD